MDYSLLLTYADCDAATAEVDFELRTFQARDAVADIGTERAGRTQASTSSDLARLDAKISSAKAVVDAAGVDDDTRQEATDELAALQVQRTRLVKRQRQAGGVGQFLVLVDAEQVTRQIETLQTIKAGIAAHRATLSS